MRISSYDKFLTQEQKDNIINDYVVNKLSLKDLEIKYNVKSQCYLIKLLGDKIRSVSEGMKIAHEKHPETFKHSDTTKQRLRENRLKYLQEHPEDAI